MAISTTWTYKNWWHHSSYSSHIHNKLLAPAFLSGLLLMVTALDCRSTPSITTDVSDVVAIPGNLVSLQISAYDTIPVLYQWYFNNKKMLNATNASLNFNSVQLTNAGHYDVVIGDSTGSVTSRVATVTVENYPNPSTVVAWGDNTYGQTNLPIGETNLVALAGGQAQTVFLRQDGTLGDFGTAIDSPATYSTLPPVAAVKTAEFYSLGLEMNGTPISFGVTGLSGASDVPASVTNAVAIAIGVPRFAVKDDGTVEDWLPAGYYGPLQTSGTFNSLLSLSNVVAIAAYGQNWTTGSHCLVLFTNGSVQVYGPTQTGDSTVVPSLTNVIAVATGSGFSLILKRNGTVVAWGDNSLGQTNVPIGLTNVAAIATGAGHSLALKSDGTIVAWGDNTYGQCNVPLGLSNVVYITAGDHHSAVLTKQPGISVPACSQTVFAGNQAFFTIVATGYPLLIYQWEFDGTNIIGATNSVLTLTNVPLTDTGSYQCVVSNSFGTCISSPATLTVIRTIPQFVSSSSSLYFTNSGLVLNLDELSGHGSVIIYASTNLQNWIPILTNPPVLGSLQILDPDATNFPFRFYQAIEQ